MGLSELMRMIIIFVTFCLKKEKKKREDGTCRDRAPLLPGFRGVLSSTREETTQGWGKSHPKEAGRTIFGNHTGLGIVGLTTSLG